MLNGKVKSISSLSSSPWASFCTVLRSNINFPLLLFSVFDKTSKGVSRELVFFICSLSLSLAFYFLLNFRPFEAFFSPSHLLLIYKYHHHHHHHHLCYCYCTIQTAAGTDAAMLPYIMPMTYRLCLYEPMYCTVHSIMLLDL